MQNRDLFVLVIILFILLLLSITGCKQSASVRNGNIIKLVTAEGNSGGTGFEVVAPSGKVYTLTNKHMCEDNATNAVVGDRTIPLRVIEVAKDTDLCLLEPLIGKTGLHVSNTPVVSDDNLDVYGYGMLQDLTHTKGAYVGVTTGAIEDALIDMGVTDVGYMTAIILPGNSGSPVFNNDGDVIGVAFAVAPSFNNRCFFIPLKSLQNFLKVY